MPRPEDVRAGRTRDWDPKFPDFAGDPAQGVSEGAGQGGAPYEPSPSTSHVYGWKLLAGGFMKFYAPSVGAPDGTRAIVQVAFKPNPPKGSTVHPNTIKTEYIYAFGTVATAEDYISKFRAAAHPGHVVQELIEAKVWYRRITES